MKQLVDSILLELHRVVALLDASKATEPQHRICAKDARFPFKLEQQFIRAYSVLKFVAPLRGKVVKINGFKFSHDGDIIKIELDYEVL